MDEMAESALYEAGLKAAEQKDFKRAAAYYQRAADEDGCIDAVFELGVCYLFGDGVAQENDRALALLKRAADAGHKTALALLVKYYLLEAPELPEGKKLVADAVRDGDEVITDLLKQICKNEKYKSLAVQYKEELSILAVQGDDDALFCVLQALMPDKSAVMEYLTDMTGRGCRKAQYHLGMCYLDGVMTEKDEAKGMVILQDWKAKENGGK